jgi:hypothetical protein
MLMSEQTEKLTIKQVITMLEKVDPDSEFCYAYFNPEGPGSKNYTYHLPRFVKISVERINEHEKVCIIKGPGPG